MSSNKLALAWPLRDNPADLPTLVNEFLPHLSAPGAPALLLLFDPQRDGPSEELLAELRRLFEEAHPGLPWTPPSVLEMPLSADRRGELRKMVRVLLRLPGTTHPSRREWLASLNAPLVHTGLELAAMCMVDNSGELFGAYHALSAEVRGFFAVESMAVWDILLSAQRRVGISGMMLEIGVLEGKSGLLLAMHATPAEKLVLVDPQMPIWVRRRFEVFHPGANLYLEAASHALDALPIHKLGLRRFRWIHIDGEHSGTTVLDDLRRAALLCAGDGVICIDDFFSPSFPQVTAATFRFLDARRGEFALFLVGAGKGYICRARAQRVYLQIIAREFPDGLLMRAIKGKALYKTTWAADLNCFGLDDAWQDRAIRGPDWAPDMVEI